jgi:hypothetical protein
MFKGLFGSKKPSSGPPVANARTNSSSFSSSAPVPSFSSQTAPSFSTSPSSAGSDSVQTKDATLALQQSYLQTLAALKYNPVLVKRAPKPVFTTPKFQGALSRLGGQTGVEQEKTEFNFSTGWFPCSPLSFGSKSS